MIDLLYDGVSSSSSLTSAGYQLLNKHLPKFFDELSESEVRSLEDIIKYNETHADSSMPSCKCMIEVSYQVLSTDAYSAP